MKRLLLSLFTVLLLTVGTAWADTLDDGHAAYKRGDYAEAVKWYRLSAAQGLARAQYNLGNMYYNGQGVTQDYAEAVKLYRLSAEQGDARAQFNLGTMYFNGQGVTQDYAEAVKWYRLAAAQGDEYSQATLGTMYGNGQGVAQDYAKENPAISCTQKLVTEPKFAPIAKKLPLGDISDINFEKLANKAIPTQKEAELIAEWVEARKSCFNIGLEYGEKNYPPQVVALAIEANNQVTAVIAGLFNKEFSYGAANKQIQTIADDHRNKLTAVVEQIKSEQAAQQGSDRQITEQRQAQAYARRQQEAQADDQRRQGALQMYLMSNKPFVPTRIESYQIPVRPNVTSNCSQIGNQWRCVTQ